ncbi:MAG: HNH endonuclease [Phycisphaeraceae bacterium]
MPARIQNPKSHLLSKISKTETGCWEWTGYLNEKGYGRLRIQGRHLYAHRLSYELFCGPLTDEQMVCHKCDNPMCCNPEHLFLGTRGDNIRDAKAKGRNNRGVRNRSAKLTDDDVRAIRSARASGMLQKDIASQYGLHKNMVYYICTRKNWGHVV